MIRFTKKQKIELTGDDFMIYKCAKCSFLFERKDEPSKCPSCDSKHVVEANDDEQRTYKRSAGKPKPGAGHSDKHLDETL